MVTRAKPTTSNTSHPLHAGSLVKPSWGAIGVTAASEEERMGTESGRLDGTSPLKGGCGSNCGLSADDKRDSLQLRTENWELRSELPVQNTRPAPVPYTTSSRAPPA